MSNNYWCRYCETYVRDTPGERKNHESTGKHQNNIQRSLRDLHKKQEREQRDSQRAKDEVARLNGLVGGKNAPSAGIAGLKNLGKPSGQEPPKMSAAAQRKAHAEQLVAPGVQLPEELKREVTGVSEWQTISSSAVDPGRPGGRTLADIKKEEEDSAAAVLSKGVHKRKAEDEEDARDEEAAPKKKVWGSTLKAFPGNQATGEDDDLDALLSGAAKKPSQPGSSTAVEEITGQAQVKADTGDEMKAEPTASTENNTEEESKRAITAPPPVMFKKRKAKR